TDARGLTDKQMQALAREMNLSETTFVLPREREVEAINGKRVRIFTTREELPFAGHPTLGTALYLYSTTDTAPDEIVLDLNVGKIPVRSKDDSTRGRDCSTDLECVIVSSHEMRGGARNLCSVCHRRGDGVMS